MLVKSPAGTRCPMEDKPKAYITDTVAVDVPETTYYQRLVDEGSLVPATPEKKKTGGDQ